MGPVVEVADLHKRYGARDVLAGVSFSVPAGSIYCLLGRNGAGKTTTVECIEGFRSPDRGDIRVLGQDPVADRAAVTPRIGVMLQEGGAYQAASPREMLRLYARLYPRARSVDDVLAVTDLQDRADARFRTLSGGEKQRVNLALAIIGSPDVLFLDEPTAGMDPAARRATWGTITRLRADGAGVLLTTHNLDEAARLADTVGVLHDGRIVAEDTPAGLVGATTQSLEDVFLDLTGGLS